MMNNEVKYKVVLSGEVMDGCDRGQVLIALAKLFKSEPAQMAKLLMGREVPLKKEYSADQAKKVCLAIRQAGAKAKLEAIEVKNIGLVDDGLSLIDDDSVPNAGHTATSETGSDDVYAAPQSERMQKSANSERDEIAMFVQRKEDKYLRRFSAMGSVRKPKFSLTWHWPSLFVFFFWALYRKLWLWAGVNLVSSYLIAYFFPSNILFLINWLIWPLIANYLYFRHTATHVVKARSNKIKGENTEDYLDRMGGVNVAAVWIGIVFVFLLSYFQVDYYKDMILDEYSNAVQYGGDGNIYTDEQLKDSQFNETVQVLKGLAALTRVMYESQSRNAFNKSMRDIKAEASKGELRDGWGREIIIIDDADQVTYLSLGMDGVEGTSDDIIQIVEY